MLVTRLFKFILALMLGVLEIIARFVWLMIPIGIHMLFLQLRTKVDKLPAMTGYFDPDSTWQMIYDGAVLVNTNPGALRKRFDNVKKWFIVTKWYWLIATIVVFMIILAVIAYKIY